MSTIMVLVDSHPDSLATPHAACTLAQNGQHDVALVQLVPVNQPGWLGTEWGDLNYTNKDRRRLLECQHLVESYGVSARALKVQTLSTLGGIICAAEQVNARVVFADLPYTILPFWRTWQTAWLRRRLAQMNCQLFLRNAHRGQPSMAHQPLAARN